MAEIVNLNDRRKQRDRKNRAEAAAAKRALFGRTKGEKKNEEKTREADIRKLDGAKREKIDKDDTSES